MIKYYLKTIFLSTLIFPLSLYITSCNDDEGGEVVNTEDRRVMLENIGTNIIIPNYETLNSRVNDLQDAVQDFSELVNSDNLEEVQNTYINAYLAWQNSAVFELGPAESVALRTNVNTFPASPDKIETNISDGNYDLTSFTNIDAKGFPALDYLLFNGDDNTVLESFAGEGNERLNYLKDVVSDIQTLVSTVTDQWNSSYLTTFTSSTGVDIGSSLGQLVNQFIIDYERVKNERIGIPLGKKSLGDPLPKNVEAFYSGHSVELAVQHLKALQNVYLGRTDNGVDGIGIDDYLVSLEAPHNGGLLADTLRAKLEEVIEATAAIPSPLSETVVNNPTPVEDAYIALQTGVVLFKTDMASALSTAVTFQDNDGD